MLLRTCSVRLAYGTPLHGTPWPVVIGSSEQQSHTLVQQKQASGAERPPMPHEATENRRW